VFAGRKLDPGKYEEWNKLYKKAALLPDGREVNPKFTCVTSALLVLY
jgi:hypothetical protein